MDSLPPNDPNRNNNGNQNGPNAPKEVPEGREGAGRQRNGAPRLNERGEVELFGGGNLGDDAMIAAMVLMGVAAYLLREICVC